MTVTAGDFNLSHYNWKTSAVAPGATVNETSCAELVLLFMTDHLMNQTCVVSNEEQKYS